MAKCIHCESETDVYDAGTPVCVDCAARGNLQTSAAGADQVLEILKREVDEKTVRMQAASEQFTSIMHSIPSDVPYPDSSLRIRQASRELSEARQDMLRAHSRLNEFLHRGVIEDVRPPDDVK